MKLSFFGAAGMVTGSNYLLESSGGRLLIDCGLFQGERFCEERNYERFPYDPAMISAVVVTHAHVDHIGRLPKLVASGYHGPIYATEPTIALARLILEDTVKMMEEDAQKRGREQFYTSADVDKTIAQCVALPYNGAETIQGFTITLHEAGHILGSAMVEVRAEERCIVFSGDLGNTPVPLMPEPERLKYADYVVMESTYGGTPHRDTSKRVDELAAVISAVAARAGVLMIPAFAIERTQELLYELDQLIEQKRIPAIPMFVDSPLAIAVTSVYRKFPSYLDVQAQAHLKTDSDLFGFKNLTFTPTRDESKRINDVPAPKVIIAGSGSSDGGRILYHELRYLRDPKNMLLLISYQFTGSIGRALQEGTREALLFGERVPVRAQVRKIEGYSAHADQEQILGFFEWFAQKPKKVFLVHGEPVNAHALKTRIEKEHRIPTVITQMGDSFELT